VARFGKGNINSEASAEKYHEARLLQLNCDKAHQVLRWYPRWDFERTLDMTVDWYKNVYDGGEAADITRKQLHEYFPELSK
jgi:CDP-glucose 4,6-dehydratase